MKFIIISTGRRIIKEGKKSIWSPYFDQIETFVEADSEKEAILNSGLIEGFNEKLLKEIYHIEAYSSFNQIYKNKSSDKTVCLKNLTLEEIKENINFKLGNLRVQSLINTIDSSDEEKRHLVSLIEKEEEKLKLIEKLKELL